MKVGLIQMNVVDSKYENKVYTLGIAPARDVNASYISYANSIISDPWGKIINRLGSEEGILIEDLKLDTIEKIRNELPLLKHLRKDVYSLNYNITSNNDEEITQKLDNTTYQAFYKIFFSVSYQIFI